SDDNGVSANRERSRFTGFEVAGDLKPFARLFVRASYSYLRARDESSGALFDELQYRPEHKYTVDAQYRVTDRATLAASLVRVTDQIYFSRNGPDRKASLNDFTVANLRVSYALPHRITVYAGVDNVFDENYETSYAFPQAGRFTYAGVRMDF